MVKNHLSRLNAPVSWPVRRKGIKFITRPTAGAHTLRNSIPLSLVLIKLLKVARTSKEVKKILHEGKILVNGQVVRSDKGFPVGVMDIVSIPSLKQSYRVLYDDKGKFALGDAKEEIKLTKVVGKTTLRGGKFQLNNADGSNIIVAKDDYKTTDTIALSLKDKKVQDHLKFEKGATIYLTGGKRVGRVGTLEDIKDHKIVVKSEGDVFETAKRHAFVVGKYPMFKQ